MHTKALFVSTSWRQKVAPRISKLLLFNFPFIFSLFLFSFDVLCFKTKMLPSFLFFFSRRESRERADVICWLLTLWKDNRQTGVDWGEVKLFILPSMCKNLMLDQDNNLYLISLNILITCLLNNVWIS